MDNTNLNPPRLRIWDQMVLKFGLAKIAGLGVGALLLAVSVGVAVVFPNFRGDLRQRASEERYGITDNLCHLPGANCTTDEDWQRGNAAARGDEKAAQQLEQSGHIEVNDQGNVTSVDQSVVVTTAPPPPTEPTPTAIERYGVTDNLCHLPGANCVTDEDWRKGNAAARGDKKATQELADTGHLKIDEGGNAVAVTQNASPTTGSSGAGGTADNKSGGSQLSDVAKNVMDGYLKNNVGGVVVNGCNVNLGLCPMIDPVSGALVGWVPSDKPVFGTFEQAGIARQNLSIGDLFVDDVKLSDGREIDRVYNYNWQDKKPEELGALITDPGEIAAIKALAEKNKVQTDEKGNVVTNQKGDLILKDGGTLSKEKFDQAAKQFEVDQENKQKEIIASVQTKEGKYTDGAAKTITDCANDSKCDTSELFRKFGGLDLLPKETRDTLMNSVADAYNKTVEEIEGVRKENQAAVKQNTELYAEATRDQLADKCSSISNTQERLDCGRNSETYTLDLFGITSKSDVDAAVETRKAEALKIELGNSYANLTDEKLREKYCGGDAARENEDCQDIKKLRENLLSAMNQKEKNVWKESRQVNLDADKFANAKSIDELAGLACKDAGGSFFGYCFNAEKEKLAKEGVDKSGLVAKISDEQTKNALIVQFKANVKADNAAQAFQGVKPSDFPDLDKLVAQKIAENKDRNQRNGCYGGPKNDGPCDVIDQQQAIALVVKEKQDIVYRDKCAELAESNAFLSCGTPDLAKQYLVTVMNPGLSQDKAKELASKLDPSFDTAAQLVAENQYQSWKTVDTVKGGVGGFGADVAAVLWNSGSYVWNGGSTKDFMALNNFLEVDQNALKLKAQEEVTKRLYSDKKSVFYNSEKYAESEVSWKLGTLNDPNLVDGARQRVASGQTTWQQEWDNYERLKHDPARSVVLQWNEWTSGRFKRGNDVLMEGHRDGDWNKIALGALTQGGDAAALTTAIVGVVAMPAAILAAGAGGSVGAVGANIVANVGWSGAVQTGVLGIAASVQQVGQAADVCSQVGKNNVTESQCRTTTILAVTQTIGASAAIANRAAAITSLAGGIGKASVPILTRSVGLVAGSGAGVKVITATQVASQALGTYAFVNMAKDACDQAKDVHCASSSTMALANAVGLFSGITNTALSGSLDDIAKATSRSVAPTIGSRITSGVGAFSEGLHKGSALAFVASACGSIELTGGGTINFDSLSMCGMSLHGAVEAARGHPNAAKQQENLRKELAKVGGDEGRGGGGVSDSVKLAEAKFRTEAVVKDGSSVDIAVERLKTYRESFSGEIDPVKRETLRNQYETTKREIERVGGSEFVAALEKSTPDEIVQNLQKALKTSESERLKIDSDLNKAKSEQKAAEAKFNEEYAKQTADLQITTKENRVKYLEENGGSEADLAIARKALAESKSEASSNANEASGLSKSRERVELLENQLTEKLKTVGELNSDLNVERQNQVATSKSSATAVKEVGVSKIPTDTGIEVKLSWLDILLGKGNQEAKTKTTTTAPVNDLAKAKAEVADLLGKQKAAQKEFEQAQKAETETAKKLPNAEKSLAKAESDLLSKRPDMKEKLEAVKLEEKRMAEIDNALANGVSPEEAKAYREERARLEGSLDRLALESVPEGQKRSTATKELVLARENAAKAKAESNLKRVSNGLVAEKVTTANDNLTKIQAAQPKQPGLLERLGLSKLFGGSKAESTTATKTETTSVKKLTAEVSSAEKEFNRLRELSDASLTGGESSLVILDGELQRLSKPMDAARPTEALSVLNDLPFDFASKNEKAIVEAKKLAEQVNALDQYVAAGQMDAATAAKDPSRAKLKAALSDLSKTISTSRDTVRTEKARIENLRAEANKTSDLQTKLSNAEKLLADKRTALKNAEAGVAAAPAVTAKKTGLAGLWDGLTSWIPKGSGSKAETAKKVETGSLEQTRKKAEADLKAAEDKTSKIDSDLTKARAEDKTAKQKYDAEVVKQEKDLNVQEKTSKADATSKSAKALREYADNLRDLTQVANPDTQAYTKDSAWIEANGKANVAENEARVAGQSLAEAKKLVDANAAKSSGLSDAKTKIVGLETQRAESAKSAEDMAKALQVVDDAISIRPVESKRTGLAGLWDGLTSWIPKGGGDKVTTTKAESMIPEIDLLKMKDGTPKDVKVKDPRNSISETSREVEDLRIEQSKLEKTISDLEGKVKSIQQKIDESGSVKADSEVKRYEAAIKAVDEVIDDRKSRGLETTSQERDKLTHLSNLEAAKRTAAEKYTNIPVKVLVENERQLIEAKGKLQKNGISQVEALKNLGEKESDLLDATQLSDKKVAASRTGLLGLADGIQGWLSERFGGTNKLVKAEVEKLDTEKGKVKSGWEKAKKEVETLRAEKGKLDKAETEAKQKYDEAVKKTEDVDSEMLILRIELNGARARLETAEKNGYGNEAIDKIKVEVLEKSSKYEELKRKKTDTATRGEYNQWQNIKTSAESKRVELVGVESRVKGLGEEINGLENRIKGINNGEPFEATPTKKGFWQNLYDSIFYRNKVTVPTKPAETSTVVVPEAIEVLPQDLLNKAGNFGIETSGQTVDSLKKQIDIIETAMKKGIDVKDKTIERITRESVIKNYANELLNIGRADNYESYYDLFNPTTSDGLENARAIGLSEKAISIIETYYGVGVKLDINGEYGVVLKQMADGSRGVERFNDFVGKYSESLAELVLKGTSIEFTDNNIADGGRAEVYISQDGSSVLKIGSGRVNEVLAQMLGYVDDSYVKILGIVPKGNEIGVVEGVVTPIKAIQVNDWKDMLNGKVDKLKLYGIRDADDVKIIKDLLDKGGDAGIGDINVQQIGYDNSGKLVIFDFGGMTRFYGQDSNLGNYANMIIYSLGYKK